MFSKSKKNETDINVILDEPLTSESCTEVVIDLIKYILYQKQQIPFAYDALIQFQKCIKATNRTAVSFKILSNTLKNVSDNLSSQFFLEGCEIKEVAILLGATIFSPKLHIRIELPLYILNSKQHKKHQHSSRKPLLKLMRSILECDEFQKAMSIPLTLTNMFIMLKKNDNNSVSKFFLPKPQYIPPVQTASCFKIKLCQNDQINLQCNCRTLIKVYHDSCETSLSHMQDSTDENDIQYIEHNTSNQSLYQWYQSKAIIKGFRFHS